MYDLPTCSPPYELSICLPGIRTNMWETFYDSATHSVGQHSFEMIICGPTPPPSGSFLHHVKNFKFVEDWGCPTRAAQIATTHATGKLMTWASDDGIFLNHAIGQAMDLYNSLNDPKVEVIMRYTEGRGRSGQTFADTYWKPFTHPDLSHPGVKEEWWTAGVGMMDLEYFRELGGWDCRYEHLNMCCHDLSFRIQTDGGRLVLSPGDILSCDWNPGENEHYVVLEAFFQNDRELFAKMYAEPQKRIKIEFDNWKESPEVWKRRFKDKA